MEGNAKELTLIARDENQHLALTQKLINILRKEKSEDFQKVIEDTEEEVINMFKEAVKDEDEWSNYLFKDGTILGLNADILSKYLRFIVNQRTRALGLPKLYDQNTNPIPWIDSYLGNSKVGVAPQEVEISSYVIGVLDNDIKEDTWQ